MVIESLKQCPLFAGLKEEDLKKIKAVASLKRVGKKQVLFSDGEEARGFYVVLSGKVKLYKISPEGKEQILHVVSPPEAFAEAALFLEGNYPAFAETLTDSQLLFFPKRDFIQLIERNPQLSINMIVSLSHFLRKFASLIEELSLKEVSSRVAKYLIDLSLKSAKEGRNPREIDLDLSKSQLASKLGTISETLSRSLAKMKAKKIIDVKKNRILILNREALEAVASGLKL
ncbi:MAG TPA: Crp/Fnr family transcriptional regulator [Thermodesulfobacteriota bacterium]|jgi:CRP/FNR family transcriptional regulator|nr:Crp/Fnr family transcriptional regulator [Thermodesulfobacteriota bacterium]